MKKIQKILIALLVVLLSAVIMNVKAAAEMIGLCSDCHTMHNSQDGTDMANSPSYDHLLKVGCVSCHSDTSTGTMTSSFGAPVVLHISGTGGGTGPGFTNAGGDFYWVDNGSDALGHNVADLPGNNEDHVLSSPPGFDADATLAPNQIAGGTWVAGTQVTCAGEYGCHGTHASGEDSFAGIKGAHHENESGELITANSVGSSFRFLNGIHGNEDTDWEWTASASDHNEYKGIDSTADRNYSTGNDYSNKTTISYLCAECHGDFHSKIDNDGTAGAPWKRHPTDYSLPNSGEYSVYTTYNIISPVGRFNITPPDSSVVTPSSSGGSADDIIICLSCHRAHGSPEPDLLRWDYSDMDAGSGNTGGCFNCHTTKDDAP